MDRGRKAQRIRVLTIEAVEPFLYRCMTLSPQEPHYQQLRRAHHALLRRHIGYQKQRSADHALSHPDTLAKVEWEENAEATVGIRKLPFAGVRGFVVRIEPGRSSEYLPFDELPEDKGNPKER